MHNDNTCNSQIISKKHYKINILAKLTESTTVSGLINLLPRTTAALAVLCIIYFSTIRHTTYVGGLEWAESSEIARLFELFNAALQRCNVSAPFR